ncbi:hypothetical protein [Nocardia acidivorans]|uniref:hypothetical protein n=1 Tax=Nocardia acidivorans TaxID=404580 RepID=UPI000AC7D979|nr:hypothetical protein [Nocardia acidivorans]
METEGLVPAVVLGDPPAGTTIAEYQLDAVVWHYVEFRFELDEALTAALAAEQRSWDWIRIEAPTRWIDVDRLNRQREWAAVDTESDHDAPVVDLLQPYGQQEAIGKAVKNFRLRSIREAVEGVYGLGTGSRVSSRSSKAFHAAVLAAHSALAAARPSMVLSGWFPDYVDWF